MGTTTPVRGLYKPLRGEVGWADLVNANMDNLDDAARSASPAFTGTPTAPTAAPGTNSTQIATTAYADAAVAVEAAARTAADALLAPKASPALTGNPTAPTQSPLDNSTKIATTAYADAAVAVEKAARQASLFSADKGFMWSNGAMIPTQALGATAVYVANANEVWVVQIIITAPITLGKVTYKSGATVVAATAASVGIYDSTGAIVFQTGINTATLASTAQTSTFTRVTLQPGIYYFAWTSTNNTTNITYTITVSNANVSDNMNFAATAKRIGKAANAPSGGSLPSTTGAITAAFIPNQAMPAVFFEYN